MRKEISRRSFLKGTLAGAVGLAAGSVLTGCANNTQSQAVAPQATQAPIKATATPEVNRAIKDAAAIPNTNVPFTLLNPQDESYDTYTTDFAAIFSPIRIGHMQLKNRIVKAAAGSDTLPRGAAEISQNALDYYGRMADGGTALIMLEDSTIGGFGFNQFSKMNVKSYEAGIIEAKKIADRVHQGGAYVGCQLGIGTPLDPGDVNAYTTDELKQIAKNYGESCLRMKQAGLDCIEIKGATTDGLNQFVTRRKNMREDEYGAQTEENRVRFFVEIIQEIRTQVGNDFAILTLINAVEENDAELGNNDKYILIEETQYLAKALEAAGADLIQVRIGTSGQEANCWAPDTNHCAYKAHGTTGYGTQFNYESHFGGLIDGAHSGVGAFIPMAKEIKKAVQIPVGCGAYIDPRSAPDMMNAAVANGDLDILFLNRSLTVDPWLPNKLKAGKREEVAPCTRCFHCHGKPYGEAEKCRVNATTQYAYTEEMPEGYELTATTAPKKVIVIGGGSAGMEAARIAAERGHTVTLYEKNGFLGGMLFFAEHIKGTHERLADLCAYLSHQLEIKGVTVVLNQEVDTAFLQAQQADAVIVAVGGARKPVMTGANVIGIDDVMSSELGENIIILGANLQATDLAQYLLAQGKKIQLVHEKTAKDVDIEQSYWVRKYVCSHLYAHGVKVWNEATVNGVSNEGVAITLNNSGIEKRLSYDHVIDCSDMVANTALFDAIAATGIPTYAAGIQAPSNIQNAIHEGYKVARYLD